MKFNVDDFVLFGKYYNEPIIWKCVKKDINGYLLISEYILSLKSFDASESGEFNIGEKDIEKWGSNKWEKSNIREWLNSSDINVEFSTKPPTNKAVWNSYNAYANESGFLCNFTPEEKNRISIYEHDGIYDKIFLLSKYEIESLWVTKKERIRYLTKSAIINSEYKDDFVKPNEGYWYWTRTPSESYPSGVYIIHHKGVFGDFNSAYGGEYGILPGLYVNSNNCVTGMGTKEFPYVI